MTLAVRVWARLSDRGRGWKTVRRQRELSPEQEDEVRWLATDWIGDGLVTRGWQHREGEPLSLGHLWSSEFDAYYVFRVDAYDGPENETGLPIRSVVMIPYEDYSQHYHLCPHLAVRDPDGPFAFTRDLHSLDSREDFPAKILMPRPQSAQEPTASQVPTAAEATVQCIYALMCEEKSLSLRIDNQKLEEFSYVLERAIDLAGPEQLRAYSICTLSFSKTGEGEDKEPVVQGRYSEENTPPILEQIAQTFGQRFVSEVSQSLSVGDTPIELAKLVQAPEAEPTLEDSTEAAESPGTDHGSENHFFRLRASGDIDLPEIGAVSWESADGSLQFDFADGRWYTDSTSTYFRSVTEELDGGGTLIAVHPVIDCCSIVVRFLRRDDQNAGVSFLLLFDSGQDIASAFPHDE